jgi:hypothetical protein
MGLCGEGWGVKLLMACVIPAPLDRVWAELGTSRLLEYVASPVQRFQPLSPNAFPSLWHEGKFTVRALILGFIPIGAHKINISFPDAGIGAYHLRDNGTGDIAQRWDHLITVRQRDDGNTDYCDEVHIEAGLLTPFVWLYAWVFYSHRQRRWRQLARNNFNYGSA